MAYSSLEACLLDLERHGQLVRVKEEVDPFLEMAAIQLRMYEAQGPAVLFERVKGTRYRAASNIFGTMDRSRFIFRKTFKTVEQLIRLKTDPSSAFRQPFRALDAAIAGLDAFPQKAVFQRPVLQNQIRIGDLPLIQHWPKDGGAFITLPQVYSEDVERPSAMRANLGMYRIQLNGNQYKLNEEIGLHYQIHRGIGVHQAKANARGLPLRVSIFVGGPPAHTLAAVMPLPEGMSELQFAGVLGGRSFRYCYHQGYCISTDADFVITGDIEANETLPEGPFGDHLGYYSLQHNFPVLKVKNVFARNNAIWPFTVVGRPPQEDTSFGALIHELTGDAVPAEIPGLKNIHAVDAAGVHPLLLAVGSERYTPYDSPKKPAELLTIANRILGTGQLSLAKYLWIAADQKNALQSQDIAAFMQFVLERMDPRTDLHFQTQTTIDTLDYSGTGLNKGSKVVFAACGETKRTLCTEPPQVLHELRFGTAPRIILPGIVALGAPPFTDYAGATEFFTAVSEELLPHLSSLSGCPLLIICEDSHFVSAQLNNFLWVTFTRSNPSHDIYGVGSFVKFKHWGCEGPIIIDARMKPHHAPPLEKDPEVERRVDRLFQKGGSLYGVI